MDRCTGPLIIGGQQKLARVVGSQKSGSGLRRYRPALRHPSGAWVDLEAGDPGPIALPDVELLGVRADGQRGWRPRHRHLALWRQVTSRGIQSKNSYLVLVLQR